MDLITRKLTLDQVQLPDWAKKEVEESESKSLIRKGITPTDMQFSEGERAAVFRITSCRLDRDQEICVPKGMDLSAFNKTGKPVMWSHIYNDGLPLGKCQWIKADSQGFLVAKVVFANHQKADDVYNYLRDGFKLSTSIGFIPKKIIWPDSYHELDTKSLGIDPKDLKRARCVHLESEIIELSICAIPSNIDAELLSVNKGITNIDELRNLGYSYDSLKINDIEIEGYFNGQSKEIIKETKVEKAEEATESGTNCCTKEEEVEFCECEDSEYEDDNCKGCGGKRKPKKDEEIEEVKSEETIIELVDLEHKETESEEITIVVSTEGTSDIVSPEKVLSPVDEIEEKSESKSIEEILLEKIGSLESKILSLEAKLSENKEKEIKTIDLSKLDEAVTEIIYSNDNVVTEESKKEIEDIISVLKDFAGIEEKSIKMEKSISLNDLEIEIPIVESKEFELEIEEKEFPIEIVEKEIEFTDEEITEIALKIIEEKDYDTVNNMQEIVKESILKLKGRMF